jgi:transcriptional regulator with XRE-family HTH domain
MIELEPNPHQRLKHARKTAGLSIADLAKRLDVDAEEADELEADADALFYNLEIGPLLQLCRVLAVEPRQLFALDPAQPIAPLPLATVLGQVQAYMTRHELEPEDFAEMVGLEPEELGELLVHPVQIHALPLSVLQDLCDTLGVEWLAVLQDLHAQG